MSVAAKELTKQVEARSLERMANEWPTPSGPSPAERVAAFLQSPKDVNRLLGKLSGEELIVLCILCELGKLGREPILVREAAELLGETAAKEAWLGLGRRILVLAGADRLGPLSGVPEWLAATLRAYLPPLRFSGGPVPEVQLRPPRADVHLLKPLLLGYLGNVRPRHTQGGDLYQRDHKLIAEAFASVPADRLKGAIRDLQSLGFTDWGGDSRICLRMPLVERYLARTRADQTRVDLRRDLARTAERAAVRALEEANGDFISCTQLEHAVRMAELTSSYAQVDHSTWDGLNAVARGTVDRVLAHPAVESVLHEGRRWARLSLLPPLPPAPVYVQPNFEILVPPETGARTAFDLALVAAVEKVDAVATLRLTPASLRGAAEAGLSVDDVLGRLRAASLSELPPTVERLVRDHVKTRPTVSFARGLVVVATDPEVIRRLEKDAEAQEISPLRVASGVFVFPRHQEPEVRRVLTKMGIRAEGKTLDADDWHYRSHLDQETSGSRQAITILLSEMDDDAGGLSVPEGELALRQRISAAMRAPRRQDVAQAPTPAVVSASRDLTFAELSDADDDEVLALLAQASLPVTDRRSIERHIEKAVQRREDLVIEYAEGGAGRRLWIQVDALGRRGSERILHAFDLVSQEGRVFRIEHIVALAILRDAPMPAPSAFGGFPPTPVRAGVKIGRNDSCPCGSGTKYKKCCLANENRPN